MTKQENLLMKPLFRYGISAVSTAAIVAIAFLLVEGGRVRMMLLLVAAMDIIVTPQILKRAGEQAAADSAQTNL